MRKLLHILSQKTYKNFFNVAVFPPPIKLIIIHRVVLFVPTYQTFYLNCSKS